MVIEMLPEVICIGMGTVDLLTKGVCDVRLDGQTRFVESIDMRTGGDATNEAFTLNRLGHSTMLITAVGEDQSGVFYKSRCAEEGIGTEGIYTDPGYPTATAIVLIGKNGERSFLALEDNAAAVMRLKVPEGLEIKEGLKALSIASLFYSKGQSDEDMAKLLKRAKQAGAATIADFVMDRKEMGLQDIKETLKLLDYIVPSLDEARYYTGKNTVEEIAEVFHEFGVGTVVIKMGAEGVFASALGRTYRVPAIADEVIDTTGAGDNFMAGFISGLIRGLSLENALYFGSAASAISIGAVGTTGAVKSREQVEQYLERHKLRSDENI